MSIVLWEINIKKTERKSTFGKNKIHERKTLMDFSNIISGEGGKSIKQSPCPRFKEEVNRYLAR